MIVIIYTNILYYLFLKICLFGALYIICMAFFYFNRYYTYILISMYVYSFLLVVFLLHSLRSWYCISVVHSYIYILKHYNIENILNLYIVGDDFSLADFIDSEFIEHHTVEESTDAYVEFKEKVVPLSNEYFSSINFDDRDSGVRSLLLFGFGNRKDCSLVATQGLIEKRLVTGTRTMKTRENFAYTESNSLGNDNL